MRDAGGRLSRPWAIAVSVLLLGLSDCGPSPSRSPEPTSGSPANAASPPTSQSSASQPVASESVTGQTPDRPIPAVGDEPASSQTANPDRPVVLLDSYHAHNFVHRGLVPGEHTYHAFTALRRACRLLEQRGCQVRELLVGPLSHDQLSDVRLIVLNLPSMDRPPWLVSELLAVEDFIRRGGGIIFITDHSNCYYHQYHLLPLWDRLGLIPTFETVCERSAQCVISPGSPGWLMARDFEPHPVNQGVRFFAMQTGGRVVTNAAAGDAVIAWTSDQAWADAGALPLYGEGPVGLYGDMRYSDSEEQGKQGIVLAHSVGQGRVIVISDQNSLGDALIAYAHNWRLWVNAVRWCGRFQWDQSQHDAHGSQPNHTTAPDATGAVTTLANTTAASATVTHATATHSMANDTDRPSKSAANARPDIQPTSAQPVVAGLSGNRSAFDALVQSEPDRNAFPAMPAGAWNVHCWEPISTGRFHWGGSNDGQYYNFWCWMNRWHWISADEERSRPREHQRGLPMLLAVEADLLDERLLTLARATLAQRGKVLLLPDHDSPVDPGAAAASAAKGDASASTAAPRATQWALDLAGQISGSPVRSEALRWQSEPVAHWGAEVAGGWLVMVPNAAALRNASFTRPEIAPDGMQRAWQIKLHRWLFDQP